MKRALITCMLIALLALPVQGATENFSTWNEVDPGGHITVSASTVTVTNLTRTTSAYVEKDFTSLDEDLTVRFTFTPGSVSHTDLTSFLGVLGLSNVTGCDWYSIKAISGSYGVVVAYNRSGSTYMLQIRFTKYGDGVLDTLVVNGAYSLAPGTAYYVTVHRQHSAGTNSTGLYTVRICTGAHYGMGGTLVETISASAPSGWRQDWRYVKTAWSRSNGGGQTASGSIATLDVGVESQPQEASIYYVDGTGGSDSNSGLSSGNAWKTIAKANAELTAGDTVYIMSGTYATTILPAESGTEGNPITYAAYPGHTVTFTTSSYGADLRNKSYITISGLRFVSCGNSWIYMYNTESDESNYNTIENCYMDGATAWAGVWMQGLCSYNRIVNNTMKGYTLPDDLVYLRQGPTLNLVAGNTMEYAAHSAVNVNVAATDNVVRDNRIFNPWHSGIIVWRGCDRTFVSGNIILDCGENSANIPVISPDGERADIRSKARQFHWGIQLGSENCRIRQNVMVNCGAMQLDTYVATTAKGNDNRIYNNILYGNQYGIYSESSEVVTDNLIINNAIHESASRAVQQYLHATSENYWTFNNVIGNIVWSPLDESAHTIDWWDTNESTYFADNLMEVPGYVAAENANATNNYELDPAWFYLATGSAQIDAGGWLTTTTGSGTSTSLTVVDANWFYDGWDIPGEVGDLIQIEGESTPVRIVSIDYETGTLTLESAVTWSGDEGVSLAFYGTGPDIGAFETQAAPSGGSIENFTTNWTEVDSANWIAVTDANLITVTAMPASQTSYVYRDMGSGYFAGDLQASARVTVTAGNNLSFLGIIGFSQTTTDWQNLVWSAQDAIGVYWRTASTTQRIYLDCMSNGVRSYQTLDVVLDTEYYLTFLRDHDGGANGTGRLTLHVTTGGYYGAGGSLVGTLTVDVPVGEQNAYRYAMTAYSMTNQGSTATITGTVSDLYLAIPGGTGETPPDPEPGEDDPDEEGVPGVHGPYYVSPLGDNDANGCKPTTPWRTLAYALANADLHATESYNVIYLMAGDHGSVSLTSKTWESDSWSTEWRIQGLSGAYLTQLAISGFHDAYLDFNDVDITRTAVHAKSGRLVALTNTSDIKIRNGTLTGYWSTTDGELTTGYSIYMLASGAGYIENIEIDGVTTNYSWDSIVIQGGGANSVRDGLVVKNCTIKNWNQSGLFALWDQAARASNDPVEFLYNTIVQMDVSRVASSVSGSPHSTCLQIRGDNLIIRGNRGTNHGGSGGVRFYEAHGPFSNMTVEDNIFYAPGGTSTTAGFYQCGESVRIANNTFISGLRTGTNAAAYRYVGGVVLGVSAAVTPDIEFANNIVAGLLDLGGTSLDAITGGNNMLYSVFRAGSFLSAMEPNDIIVVKGTSGPIQSGYTVSSFETPGEIFIGSTDFASYFATTGNRPIDFSVFAIPPDSPAVDGGRPSMGSTYDVIGATRDEAPDIGAYEYVAESAPDKARNPIPANGATGVAVGTPLEWSGPADNWDVYVGTSTASMVYQGNQQARSLLYSMAYGTTYYWRVDANNTYGKTTGDVWSFTTSTGLPAVVTGPYPAHGAANVPVNVTLAWSAASGAIAYDVWLGTDVLDRIGSQSGRTLALSLDPGVTYYWRVDAVGLAGATTGSVWWFRTVDSTSPPGDPGTPGTPSLPDLASPGRRFVVPTPVAIRSDRATSRYSTPYEGLRAEEVLIENGSYTIHQISGYLEGIVVSPDGTDPQWSMTIADSWGAVLFSETLDMTEGVLSWYGQRLPFVEGLRIDVEGIEGADRAYLKLYITETWRR